MEKGEEVQPDVPDILNPFPKDAPRNRLGLSKWMTSKDNPLTSRTIVNRVWEQLMGQGIAETRELVRRGLGIPLCSLPCVLCRRRYDRDVRFACIRIRLANGKRERRDDSGACRDTAAFPAPVVGPSSRESVAAHTLLDNERGWCHACSDRHDSAGSKLDRTLRDASSVLANDRPQNVRSASTTIQ